MTAFRMGAVCCLAAIAAAWLTHASAADGSTETVTAAFGSDGRSVVVEASGLKTFRSAFSATIEVDGTPRVLSSTSGVVSSSLASETENTPYGAANVVTSTIRFEKEQVDVLLRLGQVPGLPAVLLQAGVRNASQHPVNVATLTPVEVTPAPSATEAVSAQTSPAASMFQVAGKPDDWFVTLLERGDEDEKVPSSVVLSEIHEPLHVYEYGGFYNRDGRGFLFCPVGEPVAFVRSSVAHAGDGRVALTIAADMSEVQVDPGETRWGQQVCLLMEEPRKALPRWAAWVAKTHHARTDKGPLVGWCSWYHLSEQITGKDVLGAIDAVVKSPEHLRPQVIQIDDGYQDFDGKWDANEKFPEGLSYYVKRMAETGARPGLWMALTLVCPDTPWVKDPANLAAVWGQHFNPPANSRMHGSGWIDPTHPRAKAFIADRIRHAVATGFTYLKLDFNNIGGGNWYEKKKTSFEILRDHFTNIRQAAGEDTYILFCNERPVRATVGLVDASRTDHDSWRGGVRNAMNDVLCSYQLNGRWYAVDNDCYYMATDLPNIKPIRGGWPLVKTWISMAGLSCGAAITSDPWQWDSFRPYWRNVEVLCPPAKERTEVLDICVSPDWPRLAGIVRRDWGAWTVALLWNPREDEQSITLDFAKAGLDPQREYAVWSFWDNRFLGLAKGSWTTPPLPASGCQHLCITEIDRNQTKPVLIGSNLHIYCGAVEIKNVASTPIRMDIELTDAGAREGDLFVYSASPLTLKAAVGCTVTTIESSGENVWKIRIEGRKCGKPQRVELAVAK